MGPRPFGHGNLALKAPERVYNFKLQWGHDLQPWRPATAAEYGTFFHALQRGHGLSATETRARGRARPDFHDASMGPRPFSRGNGLPAGSQPGAGIRASMGPR